MVIREKAVGTSVPAVPAQPCPELVALCGFLREELAKVEGRQKARSRTAQKAYDRTLLAIVAAIATIALCQMPPFNGVPITLRKESYSGTNLSIRAVEAIIGGLTELGYVVGRKGFYNRDHPSKSFFGSFRHTCKFADLVRTFGLRLVKLILPPEDPIFLNGEGEFPRPDHVSASGVVVSRWNALSEQHDLTLPPEGWRALIKRITKGGSNGKGDQLLDGYSDAKRYLRRIFTDNYERGGRLYGGWWINCPKAIRALLLIDGEAVIELDYEAIHPTIIAAETRQGLNVNPYEVPGFDYSRDVGKKMFFRILNARIPVKYDARVDKDIFGNVPNFNKFRDAMRAYLGHISHKFECDHGAYLQSRDSELALNVLTRCMDQGIIAYPVHDSFIVKVPDKEAVERIMKEEFISLFDWVINVN